MQDKPTLLIIEDEDDTRTILSRLMSEYFNVVAYSSGADALQEPAEHPSVIMSDFYVPGIHGFELLSSLKDRHPKTPIAVMTGAMWDFNQEKDAFKAGASLVAYKPFGSATGLRQEILSLIVKTHYAGKTL